MGVSTHLPGRRGPPTHVPYCVAHPPCTPPSSPEPPPTGPQPRSGVRCEQSQTVGTDSPPRTQAPVLGAGAGVPCALHRERTPGDGPTASLLQEAKATSASQDRTLEASVAEQQSHPHTRVLRTEGAAAPRRPSRVDVATRGMHVGFRSRGGRSLADGAAVERLPERAERRRPRRCPHVLPPSPSARRGPAARASVSRRGPRRPSLQTEPLPPTVPERTRRRKRLASRPLTRLPAPETHCSGDAEAPGRGNKAENEDSSKQKTRGF